MSFLEILRNMNQLSYDMCYDFNGMCYQGKEDDFNGMCY